jgi:hypothetical protein
MEPVGDFPASFMLVPLVLVGLGNLVWATNDLVTGESRIALFSQGYERDEQPFDYWVRVGMKVVSAPVAGLIFFSSGFW